MRRLFSRRKGDKGGAPDGPPGPSVASASSSSTPTPSRARSHPESSYCIARSGLIIIHPNVIFVHGLTGDREKTWTAYNESEPWPQTLLPSRLSTARVSTFGYDASVADWKGMVSQSRIANHAGNLLSSLAAYWDDDDTNERLIVSICHSLGGLVCEDALVTAKQRPDAHHQRTRDASTERWHYIVAPHSRVLLSEANDESASASILGSRRPASTTAAPGSRPAQSNRHPCDPIPTSVPVRRPWREHRLRLIIEDSIRGLGQASEAFRSRRAGMPTASLTMLHSGGRRCGSVWHYNEMRYQVHNKLFWDCRLESTPGEESRFPISSRSLLFVSPLRLTARKALATCTGLVVCVRWTLLSRVQPPANKEGHPMRGKWSRRAQK
ncbi:uncharacterized protein PG986_001880 [Apiospora aurea]|uniref:DUF676 domain-containing protein n=1 Tax=Apiospora aurea TaxID=335848 RepID=A0ABR1QY81_9PEZI